MGKRQSTMKDPIIKLMDEIQSCANTCNYNPVSIHGRSSRHGFQKIVMQDKQGKDAIIGDLINGMASSYDSVFAECGVEIHRSDTTVDQRITLTLRNKFYYKYSGNISTECGAILSNIKDAIRGKSEKESHGQSSAAFSSTRSADNDSVGTPQSGDTAAQKKAKRTSLM